MYDLLPKDVPSEKEMKPGDLVFISAIYYNPKCKDHNNPKCEDRNQVSSVLNKYKCCKDFY